MSEPRMVGTRMVSHEQAMEFATAVAVISGWFSREPEPWEKELSPCGYTLGKGEPEECYHQECYEDRAELKIAFKMAREYMLEPCKACGSSL